MNATPIVEKICSVCLSDYTIPANIASRSCRCPSCEAEFKRERDASREYLPKTYYRPNLKRKFTWSGIDKSVNCDPDAVYEMEHCICGCEREFKEIREEVALNYYPVGFMGECEGKTYRVGMGELELVKG